MVTATRAHQAASGEIPVSLRLLDERQATEVKAIYGLVHPHTQQVLSYDELLAKREKYLRFIREVGSDAGGLLLFVGTAHEGTLKALRGLDAATSAALTGRLPRMDEGERIAFAKSLSSKGIRIPESGLYGYLDELSLLRTADDALGARLAYHESSIDERKLKRRLGEGFDADTARLKFTGEKINVCVIDQLNAFCRATGADRGRAVVL
jgi:hypothetical protein